MTKKSVTRKARTNKPAASEKPRTPILVTAVTLDRGQLSEAVSCLEIDRFVAKVAGLVNSLAEQACRGREEGDTKRWEEFVRNSAMQLEHEIGEQIRLIRESVENGEDWINDLIKASVDEQLAAGGEDACLVPWSVDLKSIGPLKTLVVSVVPPGEVDEKGDRLGVGAVQGLYSRPFDLGAPDVRPEVAMKRQRTMDFVEAAHAHAGEWGKDWKRIAAGRP